MALPDSEVLAQFGLVPHGPVLVQGGADGKPTQHFPQANYHRAHEKKLNRWGHGPFCSLSVPGLPATPGVYAILRGTTALYIGEGVNLAGRFGQRGYGRIQPVNCYQGGQATNCKLNHLIWREAESGAELALWVLKTPDHKRVEYRLLAALRPPWNGRIDVPILPS